MNKLTAAEARELTEAVQGPSKIEGILDMIEKAAIEGHCYIILCNLDRKSFNELISLGYEITVNSANYKVSW